MKLKAINKIEQYKSFQDFNWNPFFNNEKFHDRVNVLYGENGSGKSSVCNILKNVSQNKNFGPRYKPKKVRLLFSDGIYEYLATSDEWNKLKSKNDILFFDREFVYMNIHLGNIRDTQQGGQEQESGKMIIEFDRQAIKLRKAREKARIEKDNLEESLENFHKDNDEILSFTLSGEEKLVYKKYRDKSNKEITKIKSELVKSKKLLENKLEIYQVLQKQVDDIQNSIEEIENVEINISMSVYEDYQTIFNFDLKEQTKIQAEQNLIKKLRLNKDFFETGFEIRKTHSGQCPFCQSESEEDNIAKIIEAYNDIFDDTYKKQLQQFSNDKQKLINELEYIKQEIDGFDLNSIFLELKRLERDYQIKMIYSLDEEKSYKKPQTKKINELVFKISKLNKPNKESVKALYNKSKIEFDTIEKFFININKLIDIKNKIIEKFMLNNTDKKIQRRIVENSAIIYEIEQQLAFFNEKKVERQKKNEKKENQLIVLEKQLKNLKTKQKSTRIKYEDYASKKAFEKLLRNIEKYFENFNFNFQLALDTERKKGTTKEFPFAFKVLDSEGNERDFKEGLSEGELQVLSLCFFFAFLDIQRGKEAKILVFDDPITSLDNNNLSCLVDLISTGKEEFSQTFVFTHHKTFFKFLRNKFRGCSREYNILRNTKEYGGSFICKSKQKKFINKLKNFEDHLQKIPPKSLDVELKVVEYGQFLRYEVERFIKNNLLHWNANDFATAIEGVKSNKSISNDDLDKIKQVYSFCNWTTSHVDVGDDHGLQQLKNKISDFIEIV